MSQNDAILEHLKKYGHIDRFEARRLCRCERLASRINDLRKNHDIRTKMQYKTNDDGDPVKWAEYIYVGEK